MSTPFGPMPHLPPLSISAVNRMAEAVSALTRPRGQNGIHAAVSRGGFTISGPRQYVQTIPRPRAVQTIYARITAWKRAPGTAERFLYSASEIGWTMDPSVGVPSEITLENGREWTLNPTPPEGELGPLWNVKEVRNIAHLAGTQGTSVNEARVGFPGTFYLQPLGGGYSGQQQGTAAHKVLVVAWQERWSNPNESGTFWLCDAVNSHDGSCP